ncbi:hypothetical protein PHYSODRAFT_257173 [Phytophthora sojae]|uniref:Uncharacterized protein n=1 Tax=Phytophthora sojae (strain P6497) TaxID=1094619 RepID=G4ZHN6_PHYSP|nr:hypothetical protein PHYSODRAFT_257173 [Phytophthora sojae]EGZ18691.1 hypothetical protein PHYSODRAFT_257173 [Phytophthora sojae]|eukprot:XP_009527749.1 hypothetical protein PHYSODRAFT_257173 [Phytophthora sojae]
MELGTIDATKKIKDAIGENLPAGTIHVLVDSPLRQFEWWIRLDMKTIANFRPYEEVAERLKDHPEVKELEHQLLSLVPGMRTLPSPFVMIECSSGMGKTQMAFNLQASGAFDVFHIVRGAAGDSEQAVYKPLHGRSMASNV